MNPIEGSPVEPTASPAPEMPDPQPSAKRLKLVVGAMAAIAVVVGLYVVNRFWIAPVTARSAQMGQESKEHPFAPNFTLTDLDGRKVSLSDYKGKVLLLDFWATWCGPCRIEIPGFIQLQNRYRDQGFAVIGISMDEDRSAVPEFYKEFKMNYPVAIGEPKLGELFGGVLGLPTSFLIGRDGRIYAKHVGAAPHSLFEEEIQTLLAAKGDDEVIDFKQAGLAPPGGKIEVESEAEVNSEVPGVDLSKLSAEQKAEYEKILEKLPCPCGCTNPNVLACRRNDRLCSLSLKVARDELERFLKKPKKT